MTSFRLAHPRFGNYGSATIIVNYIFSCNIIVNLFETSKYNTRLQVGNG